MLESFREFLLELLALKLINFLLLLILSTVAVAAVHELNMFGGSALQIT